MGQMITETLLTISIWDLAGDSRPGSEFRGRRGCGRGLGVLTCQIGQIQKSDNFVVKPVGKQVLSSSNSGNVKWDKL